MHSAGELQASWRVWEAANKDAGQKIDSRHTSDVLSEHITVTQTSLSLSLPFPFPLSLSLSECEGVWEWVTLPSGHEKKNCNLWQGDWLGLDNFNLNT